MRHEVWWLVMAGLLTSAGARATELTIDRLFTAPNLSGPALRSLEFSPDGQRVTYLQGAQDDKDRFDLWEYSLRERQARLLVDSRQLVPQEGNLSPEEEARRERQRISALKGIVEYSFSKDGRSLLFPLGGDLYVYDLAAPAARAVRRLTNTESYETDARFSPRGRYVSFIRDQDLFVYDLRESRELALTTDGEGVISNGMAEFIAQEEMDRDTGYWWAPDDSRIVYARVDETPVRELERFEIFAEDVQVVRQRYPATGTPNAKVDLFIVSPDGGERVPIDVGSDVDVYLARVDWFPDGRNLLAQRQSRDQRRLDLLKVDAGTGASRLLFSETSDQWVELNDELTFLEGEGGFIWASQRSGFQHLYLYDDEGRLLRPLTAGSWMVIGTPRAIVAVDEPARRVYFTADRDAYSERHLYVASLDGEAVQQPVRITRERGWHDVKMSRDARH
ncbi:MAG TPA: DPP IV N-terminal domain-containing protein, partial [Gammaproteobacteria bacterium]|nr:DPP IV N-terminal domain-containing protein [Gammaproteobacteria bacterium]